jgi:hypothetical protein
VVLEQLSVAHVAAQRVFIERWRDWSASFQIEAPARAALVMNPERSECPERLDGSNPASSARRFTLSATTCAVSGASTTLPWASMRDVDALTG